MSTKLQGLFCSTHMHHQHRVLSLLSSCPSRQRLRSTHLRSRCSHHIFPDLHPCCCPRVAPRHCIIYSFWLMTSLLITILHYFQSRHHVLLAHLLDLHSGLHRPRPRHVHHADPLRPAALHSAHGRLLRYHDGVPRVHVLPLSYKVSPGAAQQRSVRLACFPLSRNPCCPN